MRKDTRAFDANYDVDGFCQAHKISRAFFYQLAKNGKGPRITKLGSRTLISFEAAAEWRAKMERETQGGDRNG